jgi:glutamate N-acetyltransferase/amino-acid N-acetyltransferase
MLMLFDPGTTVGGVFTSSKCPSAAVDWCRAALAGGTGARALLVNSGNANAFTGMRGKETVSVSARLVAEAVGCRPEEVLLASTGVIGEPLDASKFAPVVRPAVASATGTAWHDAARAIMTTDTYRKVATREVAFGGQKVTINGIAKGAGMIAPDMATMLSFIVTDAPIAAPLLTEMLRKEAVDSFNAITVDGDTSTSDTLLLFSTGKAGGDVLHDPADRRVKAFQIELADLLRDLAHQVVRDGEGARKFVAINVTGATSKKSARRIGMSIANSPLVKTAIAGEDANWGRIVAAVGKAGEPADRDKLAIFFGSIRVAVNGERDFDYSEAATSEYMRNQAITITVDLGLGNGRDTVWTCDLTKEYVAINGDYRS